MLGDALARETTAGVADKFGDRLGGSGSLLEPAEASRICADSAREIADALARETNALDRVQWADALATLASRAEPAEAARIRRLAAAVFTDARKQETRGLAVNIAPGLSSLATGMNPSDAGAMFASAVEFETNPSSPGWKSEVSTLNSPNGTGLIDRFIEAVSRLSTAEAARVCAQTASLLGSRLEREQSTLLRTELALSLAKVVGKMNPVAASPVCDKAIDILAQAQPEQPQYSDSIAAAMTALLPTADPQIASSRARGISMALIGEWNEARNSDRMASVMVGLSQERLKLQLLTSVLADNSRDQMSRRMARIARSAGTAEAVARVFADPFPCRLTTQELVDLLKMPTCIGAARRLILDHLENRLGQKFANHWAFVRYATEAKAQPRPRHPPAPAGSRSLSRVIPRARGIVRFGRGRSARAGTVTRLANKHRHARHKHRPELTSGSHSERASFASGGNLQSPSRSDRLG